MARFDYKSVCELSGLSTKTRNFVVEVWANHPLTPRGDEAELREFIAKGREAFLHFNRNNGPVGVYGPSTYKELEAWANGAPIDVEGRKRRAAVSGAITVLINAGLLTKEEALDLDLRNV